jgi:prophage antirepressor-like protein
MDIFENFSFEDKKIRVYGTVEEPLFLLKNVAEVFNIASINSSVIDFDESEKILQDLQTRGGIQKHAFLTEIGFYKFIMRSRKRKSIEFQKWLFTILRELRLKGFYKLDSHKDEKINIEELFIESQLKISRHNALIEASKKSHVIYICELSEKYENQTLIKIGKTDDIKTRISGLKSQYQKPVFLLHVFHCENNSEFEKYIHNLKEFKENRFNDKLENGETSREIYILNENLTMEYIIEVINKNIKTYEKLNQNEYIEYQKNEIEKLKISLEIEKQKNMNVFVNSFGTLLNDSNKKQIFKELMNDSCPVIDEYSETQEEPFEIEKEELQASITEPEAQEEPFEIEKEELQASITEPEAQDEDQEITQTDSSETSDNYRIKTRKKKIVSYIQQYDLDGNLIKYYESFIDLIRDIPGTSVSGLKHAIGNSSVYHGFRWKIIEKTEDPSVKYDIGETTEIIVSRREFIAHINIDKTQIMNVYSEQKEFAEKYKLSNSAVCCAIKRGSRTQGGHLMFYDDCPIEMREEYEKNHKLPEKPVISGGMTVSKIDKNTNVVLKIYCSISDAIKENPMSRLSLQTASNNNTVHNGFLWKISGK